jgi:hypothetical protein
MAGCPFGYGEKEKTHNESIFENSKSYSPKV